MYPAAPPSSHVFLGASRRWQAAACHNRPVHGRADVADGDWDEATRRAIAWLLESEEPAIRSLTRRDLLGGRADPDDGILAGPKVTALLGGQRPDGGFGVHPYSKWRGAHWRLVSLVELGVPAHEPRSTRAADTVLAWLTSEGHRSRITTVDGLVRRCASQEGNVLAVCSRLGLAEDDRVGLLADSLIDWQWPDGGWNCDIAASGRRSSFHESLPAMWGLFEYWLATGDERAKAAAMRTAELLLEHRVYHSLHAGAVINRAWLALHYPPYWHYDVLQALLVLSRVGVAGDPRCRGAASPTAGGARAPIGGSRPARMLARSRWSTGAARPRTR